MTNVIKQFYFYISKETVIFSNGLTRERERDRDRDREVPRRKRREREEKISRLPKRQRGEATERAERWRNDCFGVATDREEIDRQRRGREAKLQRGGEAERAERCVGVATRDWQRADWPLTERQRGGAAKRQTATWVACKGAERRRAERARGVSASRGE